MDISADIVLKKKKEENPKIIILINHKMVQEQI